MLADDQEHAVAEIRERLAERFSLSHDELEATLPAVAVAIASRAPNREVAAARREKHGLINVDLTGAVRR